MNEKNDNFCYIEFILYKISKIIIEDHFHFFFVYLIVIFFIIKLLFVILIFLYTLLKEINFFWTFILIEEACSCIYSTFICFCVRRMFVLNRNFINYFIDYYYNRNNSSVFSYPLCIIQKGWPWKITLSLSLIRRLLFVHKVYSIFGIGTFIDTIFIYLTMFVWAYVTGHTVLIDLLKLEKLGKGLMHLVGYYRDLER